MERNLSWSHSSGCQQPLDICQLREERKITVLIKKMGKWWWLQHFSNLIGNEGRRQRMTMSFVFKPRAVLSILIFSIVRCPSRCSFVEKWLGSRDRRIQLIWYGHMKAHKTLKCLGMWLSRSFMFSCLGFVRKLILFIFCPFPATMPEWVWYNDGVSVRSVSYGAISDNKEFTIDKKRFEKNEHQECIKTPWHEMQTIIGKANVKQMKCVHNTYSDIANFFSSEFCLHSNTVSHIILYRTHIMRYWTNWKSRMDLNKQNVPAYDIISGRSCKVDNSPSLLQ